MMSEELLRGLRNADPQSIMFSANWTQHEKVFYLRDSSIRPMTLAFAIAQEMHKQKLCKVVCDPRKLYNYITEYDRYCDGCVKVGKCTMHPERCRELYPDMKEVQDDE
jgi:hypothetical protein